MLNNPRSAPSGEQSIIKLIDSGQRVDFHYCQHNRALAILKVEHRAVPRRFEVEDWFIQGPHDREAGGESNSRAPPSSASVLPRTLK